MSKFRFTMKAAKRDLEGYYYTRWDQAVDVIAVGSTQQEAVNSAATALPPLRTGWTWTFKVQRVEAES